MNASQSNSTHLDRRSNHYQSTHSSLKIGRYSFSDYSVIEIENVNSLELIEMGEVNNWSDNFLYASLELKSEL